MSPEERFLRTQDIERPEPGVEVLDRLEGEGHERNGFCPKCWAEAGNAPIEYLAQLDRAEVALA